MKLSFGSKIILFTTALIVLIGAGLFAITYYHERVATHALRMEQASGTANRIATLAASPMYMLDVRKLRQIASAVVEQGGYDIVWVLDASGRLITDGSTKNPLRNRKPEFAVVDELIAAGRELHSEGEHYAWIGVPITMTDNPDLGYIVVALARTRMEKSFADSQFNLLMVLLPALVLGILGAAVIGQRLVRPLKEIAAAAEEIGNGNWNTRVRVSTTDEMNEMAHAINAMAENLSKFAVSRVELETLVTKRTKQLHASSLMSTITNSSRDAMITTDMDGIILSANPASSLMFGDPRRVQKGQSVLPLLVWEGFEREILECLPCIAQHGMENCEEICGRNNRVDGLRQDATLFPIVLDLGRSKVDGVFVYSWIIRDITLEREAERAKAEFVSTVSHELRTPLTSIKGSLGLIRSGAIGQLPDKLHSMLDIAYNNSNRLVLLINDILDMEKIEAGKLGLHMKPLEVMSLVDEAIKANKGYGDENDVTFVRMGDCPSAWIKGDRDRLMQAISNLMSNAAKFSAHGSRVELSLASNDGTIRIAVKDNGPGVPEDFRDTIFDKFSQADSSDTRQKGGTGLGLSITRAIVEQHGGAISFDSETGKGATFYIDLAEVSEPREENRDGNPASAALLS